MPVFFSLIFDLKYQAQSQKVVYLETGAAPCSVIHPSIFEKVWADIAAQFPEQTIYINARLPLPKDESLKKRIIYKEKLLDEIVQAKITSGVLVLDDTYSSQTAFAAKNHYQFTDLHIINPNATLFCNNKMPFYDLCNSAQMPHPQTWLISTETYATQKATLPNHLEHGWIIKPPDSSKGNGAAYVSNEMLIPVLAYLNDRTRPNPLKSEPRFTYFWGSQNKNQQRWPYLLQAMVPGKNQQGIETTFRIVVNILADDAGKILSFNNLGVVEKSPIPLSKKCSDSVISLTDEYAVECRYSKPFIRIVEAKEKIHQHIAATVYNDMQRFIPTLMKQNHSTLWCNHLVDVQKPSAYFAYVMPRIERGNYEHFTDNSDVLEKVKSIILQGSASHRKLLVQFFKLRYLGEEENPLPPFAHDNKLFPLLVNYVLTEKDTENLAMIWGLATFCLEGGKADSQTRRNLSSIIALTEKPLHETKPDCFAAPSATTSPHIYGPYAYLGHFPEKLPLATQGTVNQIVFPNDSKDLKVKI